MTMNRVCDSFGENLSEQALRAHALAHAFCPGGEGGCIDFHALYPYLRAARLVGGVEADRTKLVPILAELARAGARRWLVPGAADSGILATIAHAVGALLPTATGKRARQEHLFTLLDICPTPLTLNREYARLHSLNMETQCVDLTTATLEAAYYDVIVGHMVLTFLPPERRIATLRSMARWLRPENGRLIFAMRFGEQYPSSEIQAAQVTHRTRILLEAAATGVITLPEPETPFIARIERLSRELINQLENTLDNLDSVVALLETGGFSVERIETRSADDSSLVCWPGSPPRPRVVVVARSNL